MHEKQFRLEIEPNKAEKRFQFQRRIKNILCNMKIEKERNFRFLNRGIQIYLSFELNKVSFFSFFVSI